MQSTLRVQLAAVGDRVSFWAEEPAHPHIIFEYPDNDVFWAQEKHEGESVVDSIPTEHSKTSSMDFVLEALGKCKLGRLKPVLYRAFNKYFLIVSVFRAICSNRVAARFGPCIDYPYTWYQVHVGSYLLQGT
jgi:hypothetical protein